MLGLSLGSRAGVLQSALFEGPPFDCLAAANDLFVIGNRNVVGAGGQQRNCS